MYIFCYFSVCFIWPSLCLGLGCALILEWPQLLQFQCGGFYAMEGPLWDGVWGHGFLRLRKAQT
ncbi:hypothetical protein Hdeb2414_s0190g00828241 [Helianthus debilis subsp. tardiflorus]